MIAIIDPNNSKTKHFSFFILKLIGLFVNLFIQKNKDVN